jgi:thiol-disulfide isomerase/thioredoxin
MKPLWAMGRPAIVPVLSGLLLIGLAARPSPEAARSAGPDKKAPAGKEAGKNQAQPDVPAVPDGTTEQLIQFLDTLSRVQPPARDPKTIQEFSRKVGAAALQAAEKVLAQKPNQEQAGYAVNVKLEVLAMLDQSGDKEAFAKLEAFPAELQKLGWPQLARPANGVLLQARLARAQGATVEDAKKLMEDINKHLATGPLVPADTALAVSAALAAERVDRFGLAARAYQDFAKPFSASKEGPMAAFGAKLEGAARRLALLGKPLELQGVTVDGKPLDWARYRGKVVLVVFWATWCGPCRVEIGNVLRNYEAYHDKGFDVVAVSMDLNKPDLESFLAENKLPWTVLYDQALRTDGADNTMDTRYGIITIPELILVGNDGKVVSMEVRGQALGRQLQKLFGPAKGSGPKAAKPGTVGDPGEAKPGKIGGD